MKYYSKIQLQILEYLKKHPLVDISEHAGGAKRSVMYLTGTDYHAAEDTMQKLTERELITSQMDELGRIIYRLTDKGLRVADLVIRYRKDLHPTMTPVAYVELLADLEAGLEVKEGIDFLLSPFGLLLKRTKGIELVVRKKREE